MSSFRLICIAALITAMVGFVAGAAAAQSATATDPTGKPYLAGLAPPHEHRNTAHAKTGRVSTQHKATTKIARTEIKRRQTVAASSKVHRPVRLADKISSRVAWPSAQPAAADERATSETVLQFATEDTGSTLAGAPRPTMPTTSTAKPAPPAKIAATDEPNNTDSAADKAPAASTLVQTERFDAPASSQMRVILAAPGEASVTAPTPKDQPAVRGSSSTAQMLATLAGAITAGIVAWLMIGFGSVRTIRSRQT